MFHYKHSVHRYVLFSRLEENDDESTFIGVSLDDNVPRRQRRVSCREASERRSTDGSDALRGVPLPRLDCDGAHNGVMMDRNVPIIRQLLSHDEDTIISEDSKMGGGDSSSPTSSSAILHGTSFRDISFYNNHSNSFEHQSRHITRPSPNQPGVIFFTDVLPIDPLCTQVSSNKERFAKVVYNMATVFYLKQMNVESLRLLKLLEEPRHSLHPHTFCKISNNISYLWILQGKYSDAIDLLLSSLVEFWTQVGTDTSDSSNEEEKATHAMNDMMASRLLFGIANAQYHIECYEESADNYESAMGLWFKVSECCFGSDTAGAA